MSKIEFLDERHRLTLIRSAILHIINAGWPLRDIAALPWEPMAGWLEDNGLVAESRELMAVWPSYMSPNCRDGRRGVMSMRILTGAMVRDPGHALSQTYGEYWIDSVIEAAAKETGEAEMAIRERVENQVRGLRSALVEYAQQDWSEDDE